MLVDYCIIYCFLSSCHSKMYDQHCKYSKIQTILFQCKASYQRKRLRLNYKFKKFKIAEIW